LTITNQLAAHGNLRTDDDTSKISRQNQSKVERRVPKTNSGLGVRLDVVDRVLNGSNLLGVFVRNVDLEGRFERQHELDNAEGVCPEIVDER